MFTISCTTCELMVTGETMGQALDKFNQKHIECSTNKESKEAPIVPMYPPMPNWQWWGYPYLQYPWWWTNPNITITQKEVSIPTVFGPVYGGGSVSSPMNDPEVTVTNTTPEIIFTVM